MARTKSIMIQYSISILKDRAAKGGKSDEKIHPKSFNETLLLMERPNMSMIQRIDVLRGCWKVVAIEPQCQTAQPGLPFLPVCSAGNLGTPQRA
jgi:hypothetical protein